VIQTAPTTSLARTLSHGHQERRNKPTPVVRAEAAGLTYDLSLLSEMGSRW
jgi:hypothetical protein